MILVTGATGTVGREVVRRLHADVPVRIMARDLARITGAGRTAQRVAAQYGDPRSLERALSGVLTAFLVTNRVAGDDDARFLRAARSAGVRRVVKLSAAAVTDRRADDLITRWQRASEELLRHSGMEWTFLRPRAFMSNTLSWAGPIRSEGVVRALHGASANACVDPRDIAEVAVRVLTEEGHAGKGYTLTGPAPITAVEQTRQLGRLLGIPLRFEELTSLEARAALAGRYPAPVVEALLESAERGRAGAKAAVEQTVRELTGRSAGTFHDWAEDHLAAFATDGDAPVPRRRPPLRRGPGQEPRGVA
ncbi:NAD(P)H-binding protein [Streptomyces sp. b94]|uniref:NAD(P)H-binding protein n=1 Tax=Streptomyces sp. b94 TaxID=1827634 RepID=UPI001B36EDC4|nr:NAD(P)H-binding protein [Streptomyces sp. b94]MBQ1099198.1 NAD(P)H-binding protein [Streptomyces sp. b94]